VLALTDRAVEAVKDIVSSAGGVAEKGGLRLVAVQGAMQTNLQLSVVALPGEDDEVIEEQESASSSKRRRLHCWTTRSSKPASNRTRSSSRSQTSSRNSRRALPGRVEFANSVFPAGLTLSGL
jgi:hypothetical protein